MSADEIPDTDAADAADNPEGKSAEDRPRSSAAVKKLPEAEMSSALDEIFAAPDAYDDAKIAAAYRALGLEVIADPASRILAERAAGALRTRKGYSAIRIGDGEMNIISYGASDKRPALDRLMARISVSKQADSLVVTDAWLRTFRQVLLGSIARSDVVGVSGLWADDGPPRQFRRKPEQFRQDFRNAPRGLYGDWRCRTYLIELAKTGLFRGATVASNHLYFAFLNHLDELVDAASSLLLMTSRKAVLQKLGERYPGKPVSLIEVGLHDPRRTVEQTPFFLQDYETRLPRDMSGTLCLIGAGPWSLIYCQWVKERGGVGVDMGSGMNLLDGEIRRAVHYRALKVGTYIEPAAFAREEEARRRRVAAKRAARIARREAEKPSG